jgi:hypothetical protein
MEFALKKYQTFVEQSTWGTDSKQTRSIMNLAAKIGNINKWKKDADKKAKKEKSNARGGRIPIDEYRKLQYKKAPAWKKKKPKNLSDTKVHDGVTHQWCILHRMWQQHKSDECRINPANKKRPPEDGKAKEKDRKADEEKEKEKAKKKGSAVKYGAKSFMAQSNDDDESDSDC